MKDLQGDRTTQSERTIKANGAEKLERNNEITRLALREHGLLCVMGENI